MDYFKPNNILEILLIPSTRVFKKDNQYIYVISKRTKERKERIDRFPHKYTFAKECAPSLINLKGEDQFNCNGSVHTRTIFALISCFKKERVLVLCGFTDHSLHSSYL